ncbi:hypothetical protein [Ignicoccus islandicus]|uniref:hypothetical protein n=1 Tax=Ignicoccus islandicus TaxID=54259 RepID=UPI0012EE4621|nr:hypothetical protein [Ignicoccus islandicus]
MQTTNDPRQKLRTWEVIAKAEATELESCLLGLTVRTDGVQRVIFKPLACYFLHRGYLVDPFETVIPPHRVKCVKCNGIEFGTCPHYEPPPCKVLEKDWIKVVVCKCDGWKSVRGPRGCSPLATYRDPPYPLICNDEIVACIGNGECEGRLEKRGAWYWYF